MPNSMEHEGCLVSRLSRKRKSPDEIKGTLMSSSVDELLHEDLLENVLSWLPTSAFFRVSSVCKRWKSVADSTSFKLACSRVPARDPWFFMVDHHLDKSVVFDSAERSWKKLNYPISLQQNSNCNPMPVAASGGLVCFRYQSGDFVVCNPVTGSCREIPPFDLAPENQSLCAVAMSTYSMYHSSYKLVLVFGELPKLSIKIYNSSTNLWEHEAALLKTANDSMEEYDSSEDDAVYFLSKAGNVVATNMQRSPSKQYSAVTIVKNGVEIVYFLSSSGTVVSCNLTLKSFSEYPRLLPAFCEYSIDVVECRGEMLVVVLSEFFESASLRVWRFEESSASWHQIAAMPLAMSHELYGKNVDINCVATGDKIFMCLNSAELFIYVMCDVVSNEWIEMPKCFSNGEAVEFMSAFSFEPRIEASV